MAAITYTITFDSNGNVVLGGVNQNVTKLQRNLLATQNVCEKFGASLLKLENTKRALEGISRGLENINAPGMALESSLADLSAITGETGEGLKKIEGYARSMSKEFGGSAAQSVESYKLLLSQLSPELAKVPEALNGMGRNVAILSKTMGGDTTAAAEVLTTAMNQYQVSLEDPMEATRVMTEYMNVMAAAAKEGSAELPAIKVALEQSGMAAKAANVSFAETNAAIQVLDKAGKKGSEGGVALRNVMSTLSQGRFLPKDVLDELRAAGVNTEMLTDKSKTLSERLRALGPVAHDDALITKLFGKENNAAALALLGGVDAMDKYTQAIVGTNTAQEQAATIMETRAERMARLNARVDDMKIGLYGLLGALYPYASVATQVLTTVADMVPVFMFAGKAFLFVTNAQKMHTLWSSVLTAKTWVLTAATAAYNAVLWVNPVVWVVAGILALVAAIVLAYNKVSWFRGAILAAWEAIKGFGGIIKDFILDRIKGIIAGIGGLGKALLALFKGDFKTAWETAKGAASDLIGVDAVSNAVNTAKEVGVKVGQAYNKGVSTVEAKKQQAGLSVPSSIAPALLPGMSSPATGTSAGGGSSTTRSSTEAVVTGGTRNSTINITLGSVVENMSFGGGYEGNRENMKRNIAEDLIQVLSGAAASGA